MANSGIGIDSSALRLRLRAGLPPARCVLVLFFPGIRFAKSGLKPRPTRPSPATASTPRSQRALRGDPGGASPSGNWRTSLVDEVDEGGPVRTQGKQPLANGIQQLLKTVGLLLCYSCVSSVPNWPDGNGHFPELGLAGFAIDSLVRTCYSGSILAKAAGD